MERAPQEATQLGVLGFAGICREILLVIRSRPPGFLFLSGSAILLSLCLLAHVHVCRVLFSHAVAAAVSDASGGTGFVHFVANRAPFLLVEGALLPDILFHWSGCATFCVFSVAPRYSSDADRDARAVARDLRRVPRFLARWVVSIFRGDSRLAARLVRAGPGACRRLAATSRGASLLLLGYTALCAAAAALMHLPRAALLAVGGTLYLGGAAYLGTVWRVACVLSALEDGAGGGFRAMHRGDELLAGAGKFWDAAAVFTTLDVCAVAVHLAFGALVVDNRMGLRVWLRVAVAAVMAAALGLAVVAGLVAQLVVYFVCRSSGGTAKSLTDVGRKGRATRSRKRQ